MKKKIVIVSLLIILFIGLIVIISSINENVYINVDGIKYAILVDGVSSNSFPSGNYKVDINCTNANAYWDSILNKIIVNNIKGSVTCDVKFTSITNDDYLNSYIAGLTGTIQGDGELVSENGLRYEGNNPSNYIRFNNELWQIIGSFSTEYDSDNDGTTDSTSNLVKIIRSESIGGMLWNKSGNNNWNVSVVRRILNGMYYDWNNNITSINTYCYVGELKSTNCDYSATGIQDGYRNMIVKAKWYLGGPSTRYTADDVYLSERDSSSVYQDEYTNRPANTTDYIGLMYISDYLYAVLASDCARTNGYTSYGGINYIRNCADYNWLYGQGIERTITPSKYYDDHVYSLLPTGGIGDYTTYNSHSVRPTLYLSENVYRVSGTGTITDPYIIGMAS